MAFLKLKKNLSKNNFLNKLIFFFVAFIIITPPINTWPKVFLLSLSFVIIFYSNYKKHLKNKTILFSLLIFIFIPKILLGNYSIIVNHIVLPTKVIDGFDYIKNNFDEEMSQILKKELESLKNKEPLLQNIKQPGSDDRSRLYKNFAFQSENIWTLIDEGKKVQIKNSLNFWDLGPSALNDTALNFGNKKKKNYGTNLKFPVLFKVNFNNMHKDSSLCFKGNIIYKKNLNYVIKKNSKNSCIKIQNNFEYYFFDHDRSLNIKIKKNFIYDKIYIFIFLLSLIQLFLLFRNFEKINLFKIFIICSTYLVIFLYFKINLQPISGYSETIYFDRGMDGMAHYGYARIILNNFILGNYFEAFKGVEDIFYYMPLTRYINSFLMIFFGETILGSLFIISLFGIFIFKVLNLIFNKRNSKILTIIFLYIPLFEALGFTIINYIGYTVDGYGEGLCYFAMLLIAYLFLKGSHNVLTLFFIGLLCFVTVGIRPNYIIFTISFIILTSFNILASDNYNYRSVFKTFFLMLGASPILLIPIHNYIYGNELVLLVENENVQNSYRMKFSDYGNFLSSIFHNNLNYELFYKIKKHFTHYIKYYEFWFVIVLVNLFVTPFLNTNIKIKILSISLIFMHFTFLFFAGDARYSMGTWLISFIIFLKIYNDFYFPFFKSKIFSAKQ